MKLKDARRVVVVDLGFGDAGKGTVTDTLVRWLGASAVVRFNGGAQAGHTVVLEDGRHHTFTQFGAGTFVPGVRTFLSRHVVLHPTALLVEAEVLGRAGVNDALARIHVSEECLVTTPVHQAATCVRELARGGGRHGSCGVGVGETMRDAIRDPASALRAKDLSDPQALARRVLAQQDDKRIELDAELRQVQASTAGREAARALFEAEAIYAWAERVALLARFGIIRDARELDTLLKSDAPVVFEGAQGVLLDEWVGFHPYTTWSTCTWQNAEALLHEHRSPHEPYRLGVVRSFATRHGAGPFPTESHEAPHGRTLEHNAAGPWQGAFRRGWFDTVLTRYALDAAGPAHGLAVTHLDAISPGRPWPLAVEHDIGLPPDPSLFDVAPSGRVRGLKVGKAHDLTHVEALGRALSSAKPHYEALVSRSPDLAREVTTALEEKLGVSVALTSWGPTARDKR